MVSTQVCLPRLEAEIPRFPPCKRGEARSAGGFGLHGNPHNRPYGRCVETNGFSSGRRLYTMRKRMSYFSFSHSLRWAIVFIFLSLWSPVLFLAPAFADSAPASANASPEEQMAEGREAFQQGDLEQAVLHWREAARLYEQAVNAEQQS